ncbi:short transient receptor potential channel 4-like [Asterias rubens]|uniref:short transient receptor potential channel 4-like n=1 Tax=Asterias rubens TaxID=7604 RepID=UPI001455B347|nr:short transient receptor potential channel 4-like [Asterias rubens]
MSLENDFLEAVSKNQVDEVQRILNLGDMINLQCRDGEGRTPLMISIQEGFLDVISALLQHDIYIGDALLLAVEVQFVGAVRVLCRFCEKEQVKTSGKDFVNGFSSSVMFSPGTTPLQLASRLNDYAIVKILLDHNARMPKLNTVIARTTDDIFEKALAQLHWYQAITSEAYLLLASEDPMDAAFWLADQLQTMSHSVTQLKEEYDELKDNLEQFVTRLLGFARNLDEIEAVLGAQRFVTDESNTECRTDRDALPVRLTEAIHLQFKRFVAHSTCQDYMLSRWYSGTNKTWRTLSYVKTAAVSGSLMAMWPLLCIFYIIVPSGQIVNFIRTPYVRFLLHTGSRLSFILLLLSTPVTSLHVTKVKNDNDDAVLISFRRYEELRVNHVVPWFITVWILGMTLWEAMQVWRCGIYNYCAAARNWLVSFQLGFYWVYITLNIVSFVKINSAMHVLQSAASQPTDNATGSLPPRCAVSQKLVLNAQLPTRCLTEKGAIPGAAPMTSDHAETMLWSPYDPIFIAEAAFAVASVLTQLSLLDPMVVMNFVGPLQISLCGMLRDTAKFILLFIVVWTAFSLGLTHVYRTFEMIRKEACGVNCETGAFGSFYQSMMTLFWSLFDLMDLDNLMIDPSLRFTETVGTMMYVCFSVVGVVVLVNALIAMMSNTYTRVEENSDVEWKVARTRLITDYLSESLTIPPPFNIIPSTRGLRKLYRRLVAIVGRRPRLHRLRRSDAGKNFQHAGYKHIVKKLVQRFLWQEKMMRARQKHRDKLQTDTLVREAVQMVRSGSKRKSILRNTFSNTSRGDPYLQRFHRKMSADLIRESSQETEEACF